MALSFGLINFSTSNLIAIIVSFIVMLFAVKVSASWAYGTKAGWSKAFLQWILIIVIQVIVFFVIAFLLGLLGFGI
ncbi:MAG: hypothetical protein ABH821_01345 [archaeon]